MERSLCSIVFLGMQLTIHALTEVTSKYPSWFVSFLFYVWVCECVCVCLSLCADSQMVIKAKRAGFFMLIHHNDRLPLMPRHRPHKNHIYPYKALWCNILFRQKAPTNMADLSRTKVCEAQTVHWGRGKMAAISQTILSNAFSWMKML